MSPHQRSRPIPQPSPRHGLLGLVAPCPTAAVDAWASTAAPWRIAGQAERDLMLTALMVEIAGRAPLRESIAFRGGTCLHKLVFAKAWRFSEDLDFCLVGKADVATVADQTTAIVTALGGRVTNVVDADPSKHMSSTTLHSYFPSNDPVLQPEPGAAARRPRATCRTTLAGTRRPTLIGGQQDSASCRS